MRELLIEISLFLCKKKSSFKNNNNKKIDLNNQLSAQIHIMQIAFEAFFVQSILIKFE